MFAILSLSMSKGANSDVKGLFSEGVVHTLENSLHIGEFKPLTVKRFEQKRMTAKKLAVQHVRRTAKELTVNPNLFLLAVIDVWGLGFGF